MTFQQVVPTRAGTTRRDKAELMTLREIVASFLNAAEETIAQALKHETLIEVQYDSENKKDEGKDQSTDRGAAADRA